MEPRTGYSTSNARAESVDTKPAFRSAFKRQRYDRANRKADRIREKLGWEPGDLNGDGVKPKGMHWRTFERLKVEHDVPAGMAKRFGLLDRFMD